MRKKIFLLALCIIILTGVSTPALTVCAKGPSYTDLQDVYYTREDCVVYAEPAYTSTVLTTIGANVPVNVVGYYSNGWYRINIGVICYVKMDSLTTAGAIGIKNKGDSQIADAKRIADELGYQFVYLTLNKEKIIRKDIFNSYIGQKVILYAKISDDLGVSFKMLYNDKVKNDIDLNYTSAASEFPVDTPQGTTPQRTYRVIDYTLPGDAAHTELRGQMAIFQFKVGYDKKVEIRTNDLETYMLIDADDAMAYYTEFSEFAYASMTQVSDMQVTEQEIADSLSENRRAKMDNIRKGIKYLDYDKKGYRDSIGSRLRKDTEYVDYNY